jgi:hypothetical protein
MGEVGRRGGAAAAAAPTHSRRCRRRAWQPLQVASHYALSLSHSHFPTLQLALRLRESFAYDLGLRAARWAMARVEGAATAGRRVLLGWRARLEANSEAGEVELQTVQLTAADSAAMDAAPSEAGSFEGGA